MATRKRSSVPIKLRQLRVTSFKALKQFEIDFPRPRLPHDPDIFLLGSGNGLGKTTVLEACAVLFVAAAARRSPPERFLRVPDLPIDIYDVLVRAGDSKARIEGRFDIGGAQADLAVELNRFGEVKIDPRPDDAFKRLFGDPSLRDSVDAQARKLALTLAGLSPDPLVLDHFMYFHSYRKVQEGNPDLSLLVSDAPYRRIRFRPGPETPTSLFKVQLLKSLMGKARLFEGFDEDDAEDTLKVLNGLVKRYADGIIETLKPSPGNTFDFRVRPLDGGQPFTFDGLSSGQKEMISTLFLIWYYTRNNPSVVVIDEPELHLNVQWHRDFVSRLTALADFNQYIVATHSEEIFASVPSDRRALLEVAEVALT